MTGWNPFARPPSDEDQSMDSLSPNDADAARVRDLLAGLATEPAPPEVVRRLGERLDRELPDHPARHRLVARGYRRAALGALVPLAIGVAIAFAVYSQKDGNVSGRTTFGALSTAPTLADEDASASATTAAATSSAAAATVLPPATTAPVAMAASAAAQMEAATDAASVAPPVPSVVNRYPADAVDLLRARGFRIRFASAPRIDRAGPGTNGYAVVGQDPAAGTVAAPGSTVTLRLLLSLNGGGDRTSPPGPVRVPDVVGLDANAAVRRLGGVGLLATLRGSTTPLSSLAIAAQDVRPGTVVAGRTVITLAFGR